MVLKRQMKNLNAKTLSGLPQHFTCGNVAYGRAT